MRRILQPLNRLNRLNLKGTVSIPLQKYVRFQELEKREQTKKEELEKQMAEKLTKNEEKITKVEKRLDEDTLTSGQTVSVVFWSWVPYIVYCTFDSVSKVFLAIIAVQ